MEHKISYLSPVGNLIITAEDDEIVFLEWGKSVHTSNNKTLVEAAKQLDEYFKGKRKDFDLPFGASGTEFSCKVWQEMMKIPYGNVLTYGDIARKLKSHPRAVGMACGKNPIPIFIPCHRVVGQTGALTGYSAGNGVKTKEALLKLEKVIK